jgi:hypothetical protein
MVSIVEVDVKSENDAEDTIMIVKVVIIKGNVLVTVKVDSISQNCMGALRQKELARIAWIYEGDPVLERLIQPDQ